MFALSKYEEKLKRTRLVYWYQGVHGTGLLVMLESGALVTGDVDEALLVSLTYYLTI
jgi:hypothetical protein